MLSWLASVVTIASLTGGQHAATDTSMQEAARASGAVVAVRDTAVVVDSSGTPGTAPENPTSRPGPLATPAAASLTMATASTMALDERLRSAPFDHQEFFVPGGDSIVSDTTQPSRRPRAIEYSDAYHTRLKIHQIGAYLMIPLFIGEYILGQKLLTSTNRSGGLKTAHSAVAAGVGVVFVANTVTGAWNFWDSRKDPNGRARRDIHSALMLASDAGFLLTAASAGNAKRSLSQARTHRTIAISSIALSAVGSGMMWLWKN